MKTACSKLSFYGLLIIIAGLTPVQGTAIDSVSLQGRFTQPEPNTVIFGNLVRIQVQAADPESSIQNVNFYCLLADETNIQADTVLIGSDAKPPYEIVWKCGDIPDQGFGRNTIYCEIEDKGGNTFIVTPPDYYLFILDRNPHPKTNDFHSFFTSRPVVIDGQLDEWKVCPDSIVIKGSDNIVKAFSKWDKDNLYFGIEIYDGYLYTSGDTTRRVLFPAECPVGYYQLWKNDFIELSFDLEHDHNTIQNLRDPEYLVSVEGTCQGNRRDFIKKEVELWGENISNKVRPLGTVNQFSDTDSGFVVELSIPWKVLDLKPYPNRVIGFDLFNGDIDEPGGREIRATWSGVTRLNNDNPSEWGNLVLVGKETGQNTIIFFGCLAGVVMIIGFLLIWKRRKVPPVSLSQKEQYVKQAKEFIESNYKDQKLNLNKVAETININRNYLSALFNEVSNQNFSGFLNSVRIEKAKELLAKTDKSITYIAFEVGYGTLEHFIRIFKSQTGQTPMEFKKGQKIQNS